MVSKGSHGIEQAQIPHDQELVARFLRTRDEVCFRQLYRAHTPALLMLALRLTGGRPADAEDAVQETWIRATRSLAAFRWQSALRTWLCAIVINCCHEILRRRAPHAGNAIAPPDVAFDDEHAAPLSSHVSSASASHDPLDLETHVRALPEGARQVLVLHDVEGYTHEEIAAFLDIEPGTSKSQLSRARAALRQRLNAAQGPVPRSKGVTP